MLSSPLRIGLIRTGKYGLRAAGAGGTNASANHQGVDIRAAIGTPVYPLEAGTVVQIRRNWKSHSNPGRIEGSAIFSSSGAGNIIVIRGATGDINYAHLDSVVGSLAVGQRVTTSTRIGASGVTGVVQPHLHVGIHRRVTGGGKTTWVPVDPTPLLPWTGDKFGELKAVAPATPTAPIEEDDMFSDEDRRDQKAMLKIVGDLMGRMQTANADLAKIVANSEQTLALAKDTKTIGQLLRWAVIDDANSARKVLANLSNSVKEIPGAGQLGTVSISDADIDRIAQGFGDRLTGKP